MKQPDPSSRIRIRFDMEQQAGREISVTLETKRNVWHLDGLVPLDGSQILNAIDRKEDL